MPDANGHATVPNRCVQCGARFEARIRGEKIARFCSRRCARKADYPKRKASLGRKYKRGKSRVQAICAQCGRDYVHWAGQRRKYCSRACGHAALREAGAAKESALLSLGLKQCIYCKCEMPLNCFPKQGPKSKNVGGLRSDCKLCLSVRSRVGRYPVWLPRAGKIHVATLPNFRGNTLNAMYQRYWASLIESADATC